MNNCKVKLQLSGPEYEYGRTLNKDVYLTRLRLSDC